MSVSKFIIILTNHKIRNQFQLKFDEISSAGLLITGNEATFEVKGIKIFSNVFIDTWSTMFTVQTTFSKKKLEDRSLILNVKSLSNSIHIIVCLSHSFPPLFWDRKRRNAFIENKRMRGDENKICPEILIISVCSITTVSI